MRSPVATSSQALRYRQIALASFVGYAFSHNVGASFLGGGAIRYRLYSSWGLSASEIATIVAFNGITFWLGFLLLTGLALVLEPAAALSARALPAGAEAAIGAACIATVVAYVGWSAFRRTPIRWGNFELRIPPLELTLVQLSLSTFDWALAASVLYVLLPASPTLGFAQFLAAFLLAQIAGLASHLPGGLGVFETVILMSLSSHLPGSAVLGSLVAYRVIYYLMPLIAAGTLLGMHELLGRTVVRRVGGLFGRIVPEIVPQALAITTFLGGVVLLASGATPAIHARLAWLQPFLPLTLLEASHVFGSLTGVGLLLLARGLQNRLDAAYLGTVALLAAGIVFSLLKGLDYEEAIILSLMLAAVLPCRAHFYRRASLLDESFTAGWSVAIALVVLGSFWLILLSHRHLEYSHELWWEFEFGSNAPRALRATTAALGLLVAIGLARLLRPATPRPPAPTPDDLTRVQAVVAAAPRTYAHLALLGDKALLVRGDASGAPRAFLMYGVEGRSWVALGDPVGSPEDARELAWRFRELSDRHAGWTVFYEVGADNLPLYLDLGLSLLKLGEEARVPLATFTLEGGARKGLRQTHRKVESQGASFALVPAHEVRGAAADAGRGVGRVARGEGHPREGLLARLLRSRLSAAQPARGRAPRRSRRRVRQRPLRRRTRGALDRPHAVRPGERTARRHGLPLPRAHAVGPERGLSLVQPRHGAVLGLRRADARAALESRRRVPLPARRALLQLPGRAPVQGQVRSGVGAALPGLAGRSRAAAHPRQRRGARVGRAHGGGPQVTRRGAPRAAVVAVVALVSVLRQVPAAAVTEESAATLDPFGKVELYRADDDPTRVVLLLSDADGWNRPDVESARALASLDALVIGVDVPRYLATMAERGGDALYPFADLEVLSQFVQKKLRLAHYVMPIVIGRGAGATLAYAVAASARPNGFAAAVSLGFCPTIALPKPLGPGSGLALEPGAAAGTYRLRPSRTLVVPWTVLQGQTSDGCDVDEARRFAEAAPGTARMTLATRERLDDPEDWLPHLRHVLERVSGPAPVAATANGDVGDLPLVEVPAHGPPTRARRHPLGGRRVGEPRSRGRRRARRGRRRCGRSQLALLFLDQAHARRCRGRPDAGAPRLPRTLADDAHPPRRLLARRRHRAVPRPPASGGSARQRRVGRSPRPGAYHRLRVPPDRLARRRRPVGVAGRPRGQSAPRPPCALRAGGGRGREPLLDARRRLSPSAWCSPAATISAATTR